MDIICEKEIVLQIIKANEVKKNWIDLIIGVICGLSIGLLIGTMIPGLVG
ncbi:hypothetical protein ES702_05538 [subsurface metagenome]